MSAHAKPPPLLLTADALASANKNSSPSPYPTRNQTESVVSGTTLPGGEGTSTNRDATISLPTPVRSVLNSLQIFSDHVSGQIERKRFEQRTKNMDEQFIRDYFPRMPWHDIHACVTGLPVRDLAAHFIQVIQ
jgi:hypothetical protein